MSEARRGVLDWIGCALAGSGHKTVTTLLSVLQETSGRPQATVFGRGSSSACSMRRWPTARWATCSITTTPIWAASCCTRVRRCWRRCSRWPNATPVSGADFMLAYAIGFEAGVRTGRTAPGHHKGGWHLTGTLGTIAAGAAAASCSSSTDRS